MACDSWLEYSRELSVSRESTRFREAEARSKAAAPAACKAATPLFLPCVGGGGGGYYVLHLTEGAQYERSTIRSLRLSSQILVSSYASCPSASSLITQSMLT